MKVSIDLHPIRQIQNLQQELLRSDSLSIWMQADLSENMHDNSGLNPELHYADFLSFLLAC